jgi:hypothetical protein
MSKQKLVAETKSNQNRRPKVTPPAVGEWSDELIPVGETIQAQATQLGNPHLQAAQRQALATQIGQRQGNQHLQRVIELAKPAEPQAEQAESSEKRTVQRFRLSAAQQKRYPRFKKFVQNEMPKTANDKRIVENLNKFGTNMVTIFGIELFPRRNIADDVAWDSGPTIKVTPLAGANGEFTPGINSTELRIDKDIVRAYQKEKDSGNLPARELLLESTILHEYTHFLDDQDATDRPGEEGQGFEEATYGIDIDDRADAQSILSPRFGSGDWTVTVEAKNTSVADQRFIISGAKNGNGTYEGTVGNSVNVKGRRRGKWRILIQHKRSKKWKASKMHKVLEGTDDFMVRSENWTNRDMDDLVLRVKK